VFKHKGLALARGGTSKGWYEWQQVPSGSKVHEFTSHEEGYERHSSRQTRSGIAKAGMSKYG
jgi:hypothetical protein